jgi:hypothetical protein
MCASTPGGHTVGRYESILGGVCGERPDGEPLGFGGDAHSGILELSTTQP